MRLSKDMVDNEDDKLLLNDCCETGDVIKEVPRTLDASLSLPALQCRPKRTIRPVQDKENLIKFVDSDDDSDDEEDINWEIKPGEEVESGNSSPDEEQLEENSSHSDDSNSDENYDGVDENLIDNKEGNENEENLEPVSISKEDMPFLFIPRGAGKRQIKVIQFKNEIAEKAKDMSDESSSEDENWQAKEEDITEQIIQENGEEEVDMTDIPLMEKTEKSVNTVNDKKAKSLSEKKPKLTQSDALQVSICCVCLSGPEEDNVIECDSCGVTVHEGCYGATPTDPDNDQIDMTWFCEPCVANLDIHQCELCPNKSGAMKHTDSGKFAHMVCALYSDGIGFNDTTKLEPIITTDIPPSKFGYKKCDLCEDIRYAYTGLVVECDAGLCKSSFHITCAQKLGYLMENSSEDVKTNPFFAYCKVHVDKDIARPNKKSFQLLLEHLNAFKNKGLDDNIKMSLEKRRKRYLETRTQAVVPAVMTERHPRALFGSVSAFTKLTKKAELFGLDTHANIVEETDFNDKSAKVIKPDVSVEFAKQYELRQNQRKETVARHSYHYKNLLNLREEEHKLQAEIYELQNQVPKISKKYEKIRKQAVAIWKFLSIVEPTEYDIPDCLMQKQNIKIKSHVIKKKIGLKFCQLCKHADALESMVDCDECHCWFHFSCLDPPVTRNPKVNKKWAWFCTACTTNDIENQDSDFADNDQNGDILEDAKQIDDKSAQVKSTKFGRTVKKPDHYKSEAHNKEKLPVQDNKSSPKKSDLSENVVALTTFPKAEETLCNDCEKKDSVQKIFCDFCKKYYHLHCTSGSYESSSFICNACEALTAPVPNLEMKHSQISPVKSPVKDTSKSQKRKNIFELQYDLLCQKRKREDTSEYVDQNAQKKCNIDIAVEESDIVITDNNDSIIKVDPQIISKEDSHTNESSELETTQSQPNISSPPKPSLFSNIMKDIQKAVAKVPENSKVKLGMSPIKSMIILDESSDADAGNVVPVIVEVGETDSTSHQTVLTILTSENLNNDTNNFVQISEPYVSDPTTIPSEKSNDSDASLPDVLGS